MSLRCDADSTSAFGPPQQVRELVSAYDGMLTPFRSWCVIWLCKLALDADVESCLASHRPYVIYYDSNILLVLCCALTFTASW